MSRLEPKVRISEFAKPTQSNYEVLYLLPANIVQHIFSLLRPSEKSDILTKTEKILKSPSDVGLKDDNLIGMGDSIPESRYLTFLKSMMRNSANLYNKDAEFSEMERADIGEEIPNPEFIRAVDEPVEAPVSKEVQVVSSPEVGNGATPEVDDLEALRAPLPADSSDDEMVADAAKSGGAVNLEDDAISLKNGSAPSLDNAEKKLLAAKYLGAKKRKLESIDVTEPPKRLRLSKADLLLPSEDGEKGLKRKFSQVEEALESETREKRLKKLMEDADADQESTSENIISKPNEKTRYDNVKLA